MVVSVVLLDQLSKSWAQERLASGPIHLLGPISLRLQYNRGVAFSLGAAHGALVLAVVAVLVAVLALAALRVRQTPVAIAVGLVLGGALSNLGDRLFRRNGGAVIDFVYTRYWPTFNVADSAIVVGVVLLALLGVRERGAGPPPEQQPAARRRQ